MMDIEEKKQLLTYLEYQMSEQDKAILKGNKYINKTYSIKTMHIPHIILRSVNYG